MAKLRIPMFQTGATQITPLLSFKKEDGWVVYFNGQIPIAMHREEDLPTFRMVTSQFYHMGLVSQSDLKRVFGLAPITVTRAAKIYCEHGPAGFYRERPTRGPGVLVPEVVEKAEELLAAGIELSEVARQLSVRTDTLRKAISSGRIHAKKK